jgi:hypothetical protein
MATRLYVYGMGWFSLSCGCGGGTDGRIRPAPRATVPGWSAGGGGQAARRPASSSSNPNPMCQPQLRRLHRDGSWQQCQWVLPELPLPPWCVVVLRTMKKRRRGGVRKRCWIYLVSHKRELPECKMGLEQKIKNLEHAIGGRECKRALGSKVRIWESNYGL